ncbi:MAG: type II toxin-antitoxin system VapC family toxin [Flavobacteriaceae bacterium]|jgi:predicted nucleic acid-binding protein|nr:type II toxin-antitoxin system VapC family toxin [Flavobacteriaceae bacterium]
MSKKNVYVDTNVLVNYFTQQADDVKCLNYLFTKVRKEILFTSSLAVVQAVGILQTKKKNRSAFTREKAVECIEKIYTKFSIIDLFGNDVKEGTRYENKDVEDNVHYVLCKKLKCSIIVTNDTSDYSSFWNVVALSPKETARIRKVIK